MNPTSFLHGPLFRTIARGFPVLAALLLLLASGCGTARPQAPKPERAPELDRVEALLADERYAEAIVECINLQRKDPLLPGLGEMQNRIMARLTEIRRRNYEAASAQGADRMAVDVERHLAVPETYGLRRRVRGETEPPSTPLSPMQQALTRPVTVHLADVTLEDFISQVGADENINIVADGNLSGPTLTIHATDTPLEEILDFVGRNLGVTFSVGQNLIWATAAPTESPGGEPLETRIYRLRKGLTGDEIDGGPESVGLLEAVTRFVPPAEGADILYTPKAHALVARNTKPNFRIIEDLIAALDVTPPQVLIEARFMSLDVSDLRELGIDWVLNSPMVVNEKGVVRNGAVSMESKSEIFPAAITTGASAAGGKGLNLTYTGILTDPMFEAVLHALETSGKTDTLSVPRVTTINNREAFIHVGRDFYYYEEWDFEDVEIGGSDNTINQTQSQFGPVGNPVKEELGYKLTVTPSVGADRASVHLKLKPEVSDFVDWHENAYPLPDRYSSTNSSGGVAIPPLPVFERREIETELAVRSGETVVMGGLMTSKKVKMRTGVPILSSLPFLGQFFRTDTWQTDRNNLLIFVTATIISQVGEELIPLQEAIPAEAAGEPPPPETEAPAEAAEEPPDMTEPVMEAPGEENPPEPAPEENP